MVSPRTDCELRRIFAGRRLYIPRRKRGDGYALLVAALGSASAEELVAVHGGETLVVPLGGRRELRAELRRRWEAGESVAALAALAWPVRLSERTVARYLIGAERPSRKQSAKAPLRLVA